MNDIKKIVYMNLLIIIFCVSVFWNNISANASVIMSKETIGPGSFINEMRNFENFKWNDSQKKEMVPETIYEHDGKKYVKGENVGSFSLSGYCACKKCGTGTGLTASGKKVRENHTVAADWNLLPKGTMIILEDAIGKDGTDYSGVYAVEDRGGGIKNKRIDIYRPTHELALLVTHYGKCYGNVYIAIPIGG